MTGREPSLAIVGARGYIGTRLSALAEHVGVEVQAITRNPGGHENDLDGLLARLQHADRPTTIVWLLAGPQHDEERQLRRLLTAAPDHTRLVYASSCAVYGQTDHAADEDAPPAPQDDYAISKARCETLVAASQLPACVLRLATVYSHPTAGATKQSVHQLIHQATTGAITLYAADDWRPFLSLDAAAYALLRPALNTTLIGTYNVAQEHATFGAIARHAAELLNARIITTTGPIAALTELTPHALEPPGCSTTAPTSPIPCAPTRPRWPSVWPPRATARGWPAGHGN